MVSVSYTMFTDYTVQDSTVYSLECLYTGPVLIWWNKREQGARLESRLLHCPQLFVASCSCDQCQQGNNSLDDVKKHMICDHVTM